MPWQVRDERHNGPFDFTRTRMVRKWNVAMKRRVGPAIEIPF